VAAPAPYHVPVLVEEVLSCWVHDPGGRYVDATVGGGGHAQALLERAPGASLVGLDRDPDALHAARERLRGFGDRVSLLQGDWGDMEHMVAEVGAGPVAGVLADLGVSSRQLDDPARGFSYLAQGPLRLMLDRDAPRGAAEFLAETTEAELTRVFRELGELSGAGSAARAVLAFRARRPIATTFDLVEALGRGGVKSPRRLSQAFQALRLAVNKELESLRRGLAASARLLPPGGTLVVISFESLMDRIVKHAFRPPRESRPLPGQPDPVPVWEPLTRRVVRPGPEEVRRNPRARSAKLRAARRTDHAVA
jgi:16S rRNA (cytosine1402-N4)-methyltransferase